jgi:hypothetical protein
MLSRAKRALLLTLLGGALTSCGAKTGLETPDVPIDAAVLPDAFVPPRTCIEVPRMGRTRAAVTLPANLRVVDVMFVIDSSGSMQDEIEAVRGGLRERVVPGIRAIIPDAAFGVALFGEFPVEPHARPESGVLPYLLRTPLTTDIGRVEAALERTPDWRNLDFPEAGVEALFQAMTGEGLSPWIPASTGCPSGGSGGACFRAEAFHVAVLITDAALHNGPPGIEPIAPYSFTPRPHSYADMIAAATRSDTLVLGLAASDVGSNSGLEHLQQVARDTGAVDSSGAPLAFDIGADGGGIGEQVVRSVQRLALGVPLDVDAIVEDVPGDAFDARTVVTRVIPVSASPMSGVGAIEPDGFRRVVPGTELTFDVEVDASSLPVTTERIEIPARLVLRESRRARLGSVNILIVIPGTDGRGC